jgi:hypothetical protein
MFWLEAKHAAGLISEVGGEGPCSGYEPNSLV